MTLDPTTRQQIAQRIRIAQPLVNDVLLFGSQARGDARQDSDVDLLIVVPDEVDRRACGRQLQLALDGLGLGFDLVVLSETEFAALRASHGQLQRTVLREARDLLEAA